MDFWYVLMLIPLFGGIFFLFERDIPKGIGFICLSIFMTLGYHWFINNKTQEITFEGSGNNIVLMHVGETLKVRITTPSNLNLPKNGYSWKTSSDLCTVTVHADIVEITAVKDGQAEATISNSSWDYEYQVLIKISKK